MNIEGTTQTSFFSNPIALICGFFCIVPGMIIGQIVGLSASLLYAPFVSLFGGVLTGMIGYLLNTDINITPRNFYKYVAIAMASVIGALWGGMILAPLLFFKVAFLSTNIALIFGILFGINVVAGLTYITLLFLDNTDSAAINAFAMMLIGMTLFGCVGLMYGPQIWALLLNAGVIAGIIAGIVISTINNLLHRDMEASKILASLFAMSGVLVGVMLGAILSAYIPFVSSAAVSIFFGFSLMVAGALLGYCIGNNYPDFDLNNENLRHKLYQAAFLLPVIFFGYLSGGIIGFLYLPLSETLLSQAVGIVVSSSLYGLILTSYYTVKDFIYSSDFTDAVDMINNLNPTSVQPSESHGTGVGVLKLNTPLLASRLDSATDNSSHKVFYEPIRAGL